MVHAALRHNARRADGSHGFRHPEEVVHLVGVVHMQVEQCAAGARAVHKPVLPGISVNRRRDALERGGLHLPGLAALEVFAGMAVFRPRAHAKPHVEERLGLLRGGDDALHLRRVAAERLLAEYVLAGGKSRAHDVRMVGRRHADVDDVDVGVADQRTRVLIHRHARQVERLRVVAAADVPDDGRHVAPALLRVDVGQCDDLRVLKTLVYAPVGRAHEAESDDSNLYFFHCTPKTCWVVW